MVNFCTNILKGIFLGAGAILPGISSGVLCVIFGIYEKLVNSVLGIFKDFKTNFKFLLPLCIGGFVGVLLFGNSLNFLFAKFPMQSNFAFMGLILGTTPAWIKNSNKDGFKVHYLLYALLTFLLTVILLRYEASFSMATIEYTYSPYYLVICGFFMSIGVVVPGVSSTVILMILGIYSTYLESISCLNLSVLIPMGIGLVVGCIMWLKIIQVLLSKFYTQTFYSIIGFVFGSLLILYPGITFNFSGICSLLLFLICICISFSLEKTS